MNNWLDDPEWEKHSLGSNYPPKKGNAKKLRHMDGLSYPTPKIKANPKPAQEIHKTQNLSLQRRPKDNKKVRISLEILTHLPRLPSLTPRQLKLVLLVIGAVVLIILAVRIIGSIRNDRPATGGTTAIVQELPNKPQFGILAPSGKPEQDVTSSQQYDRQKQVLSYQAKIAGLQVTVSQQALPSDFKGNTDEQVEKLAQSFSASKVIYAGEVKAFSGVSEKGPQTVIFSKKEVLIFIYAPKEMDKDGLVQYILELK